MAQICMQKRLRIYFIIAPSSAKHGVVYFYGRLFISRCVVEIAGAFVSGINATAALLSLISKVDKCDPHSRANLLPLNGNNFTVETQGQLMN